MRPLYTVYLSSTSYHWWNFKSKNWKNNVINMITKRKKDINFCDPLMFKSESPSVCPLDIRDINRSSYVIVYIDKVTVGTMLELGYCIYNNLKYGVLTFNKKVLYHPWIQYLCKDSLFTDYKSIVDIICMNFELVRIKRLSYGNQNKNSNRTI